MGRFSQWGAHGGASVLTAIVATGAITQIVPPAYQHQAMALIMVALYMLGVAIPTPAGGKADGVIGRPVSGASAPNAGVIDRKGHSLDLD